MRITFTTVEFCEAMFRLQKRLALDHLQDQNFAEEMEAFAIGPREWWDINEIHGYHGELAIISDPAVSDRRKISLRVVHEETGTVYSVTTGSSYTAEDALILLNRGLDPDTMVREVRRIFKSIPGMLK